MTIPVFDMHCDTAFAMLNENLEPKAVLSENELHFDLKRAGEYPTYVQCFACYSSPLLNCEPQRVFEMELCNLRDQLDQNREVVALAGTAGQICNNASSGKISAVLSIEGPAGFGYDPGHLQSLHEIGFRITTLGWNERNPLTGSHLTGEGLSERGREYVKEAQRLGMIIDVSHISDAGFYDIMDMTSAPVIASHSNSRSVCNVSRNLTDDMFRQICRSGGVAGINLYMEFVGGTMDVDAVCDHIFHFLELDPDGKHIALGGDLDGCEDLPKGIRGIQDYAKIAQRLIGRGLDEQMVTRIFWDNALGVMERCCM